MSNKTKEYMIIYFSIYIVLAIIYGIAQRLLVCTDMYGFQCNFNENKLIAFLTVVAYILTPAVAIYGFSAWREQHNALVEKEKIDNILNIMGVIEPIQEEIIEKFDNVNFILKIAEDGIDKHQVTTLLWDDYKDAVQKLSISFEELYYNNQDKNLKKLNAEYFSVLFPYTADVDLLINSIKKITHLDQRLQAVHDLITNTRKIFTHMNKDYEFHAEIPFLNYDVEIRKYYNALHSYIIENKSKV